MTNAAIPPTPCHSAHSLSFRPLPVIPNISTVIPNIPTVIDGRPHFAKLSIDDGKQVKIAAIDPDFS